MAFRVCEDGIVRSLTSVPVEEIMFGDYLEREFSQRLDGIALVDAISGDKITFGELLQICRSVGAVLQREGVQPQDIVVFCAATSLRACCVLLALIFCQATVVVPTSSSTEYELEIQLSQISSVRFAVGDGVLASKLRKAVKTKVFEIDDIWSSDEACGFTKPGPGNPKRDNLVIAFTSGSTGPSKAIGISNFSMVASFSQWYPPHVNFLLVNPISHMSGMATFFVAVTQGHPLFIGPETLKSNEDKYAKVCAMNNIETILIMPILFSKLTEYDKPERLASVKKVYSVGSTIPQGKIDKFRSRYPHINVEIVFAMSETCAVVMSSKNMNALHKLEILPNVDAKIVDLETNAIAGHHQNGALHIKAPSNAVSYLNNSEATKETFLDGWVNTGDLAYRDEEGRFVIVDRIKQLMKCLDTQVAPADLETILREDSSVSEVLVAGVPDSEFGEAPAAFVIPYGNANLEQLRNRLVKTIEDKCAFYKHLHGGVIFVKAFPATGSGKFSRRTLVELHLKNQLPYL